MKTYYFVAPGLGRYSKIMQHIGSAYARAGRGECVK